MADLDETARLAHLFIAQRRELGDGLWPSTPPTPSAPPNAPKAAGTDPPKRTAQPLAQHTPPDALDADRQDTTRRPREPERVADADAPAKAAAEERAPQEPGIVVPAPQLSFISNGDLNPSDWQGLSVEGFGKSISGCQRCVLGETRTNFVFGVGHPDADIIFIGEAPGADEDAQGIPFVGRAGKLLTKMIEAMKLSRDDVYIANILKCRPPNNRNPLPNEIQTCLPYLEHQIRLIKPRFICALGRVGAQTLLNTTDHNFDRRDLPIHKQGTTQKGITIGNDVYVGSNVTVLDGVTVGEGCVLAAGAVLSRDIPPFSVAAGVPARVIKERPS